MNPCAIRAALLCAVLLPLSAPHAMAARHELRPSGDSTIFASLVGDPAYDAVSDGGPYLWVSTTAGDVVRRALLRFDTRAIPPGSRVLSAELRLHQSRSRTGHEVRLHKMLASWQPAATSASANGHGVTAMPGDVTWSHRVFPSLAWTQRGGDFDPVPSSVVLAVNNQSYTWPSTPRLVADVQGWIDAPDTNHGVILIGDEVNSQSAKQWIGSEFDDVTFRPLLIVETEPAPPAAMDGDVPLPPWALWSLAGGLVWLMRARPSRRG